ncbi:hypothetical protein BDP55DRAFT_681412 [Colletotrichum godetiae]|uniref:Uncharacterized protein n=1 Tax=Colletotrichum godetiae TaxID=1209918 RepID=A0AAJ0AC03_9PEZI|nr:uncharacterized protein BDP55DRAFT_681412 [Colletotrichum godetiae]KAK1658822.1 hypothetical protein BDP55DRAFT_681412 [Colletotrichum godetiae]
MYSLYQNDMATLLDLETHFSKLANLDDRVFGEVTYSRKYSLRSHGGIQDWCLVPAPPESSSTTAQPTFGLVMVLDHCLAASCVMH